MTYEIENKTVTIPDSELDVLQNNLGISQEDAIQLWLEDHNLEMSDEYAESLNKAKGYKVDHGTSGTKHKEHKKVTRKASDEKQEVFQTIKEALAEYDMTVEKENKLIIVRHGGKTFKVDLIEQRPKKN